MPRKHHSSRQKAALGLEVIRGERTINEIASSNNLHPAMLARWKKELEENSYTLFENANIKERKKQKETQEKMQDLYAQIGKLSAQLEWLKKKGCIDNIDF